MSDRTKCEECNGEKVRVKPPNPIPTPCPSCDGTGEVESPWTKTPPTEPGWYGIMFGSNQRSVVHIYVANYDLLIQFSHGAIKPLGHVTSVKYWSREPIRFPDAPEGE